MGLDRYLSTQGAILLGSGMIALGLFFGLRGREDTPPPPPAQAPASVDAPPPPPARDPAPSMERRARSAQPTQPARPAPTAQTAPAAPPEGAARDEVTRQAAQALEARRRHLVDRCWKPSLAKSRDPPSVRYVFNITFDAEGRQLARGLAEDRAAARPDVTTCLGAELTPLAIPAPGAVVQVEVPFSLP